MYETHKIVLPAYAEKLFTFFLSFYPESYRKTYGYEMYLVFQDMFLDAYNQRGYVGITFWLHQLQDAIVTAIVQHGHMIHKKGFKTYLQNILHINIYNFLASLFLFPVFIVFVIDFVARVLQGDLTRYNRPVYAFLSHTPLYYPQVLFVWVILFPLIAVGLTLFSLVRNSKKSAFTQVFIKRNIWSLLVLSFALGFLALIKLHDFLPCTVHGILKIGIQNLPQILRICRNA